MKYMSTLHVGLHFIFLGDDIKFISDHFSDIPNSTICSSSMLADFTLMTLCDHGILSPSTFSLSSALIKRSVSNSSDNTYIAPLYWAGCSQRKWFPTGFNFSWIIYI